MDRRLKKPEMDFLLFDPICYQKIDGVYFYNGLGCHRHPDCFTCPFPDCITSPDDIKKWNAQQRRLDK